MCVRSFFFFQAEDGIRDLVRSRGLGDVYKRQQQVGILVNQFDGAGSAEIHIGLVHQHYAARLALHLSLIHI